MIIPSSQALLAAWERGWQQRPAHQALLLLACAFPQLPASELAAWPLGERNRRLMGLRQALFGPQLMLETHCPKCAEELELPTDLRSLLLSDGQAETCLRLHGFEVELRPLSSRDLLNLPGTHTEARFVLLNRCVVQASHEGSEVKAPELPAEVIAALEDALAQLDPQAVLDFELVCPSCQHAWTQVLDIAQVLWREVDHWAKRTLLEVHRLASAYGWSEGDVLSLSPTRRQLYLQCLN